MVGHFTETGPHQTSYSQMPAQTPSLENSGGEKKDAALEKAKGAGREEGPGCSRLSYKLMPLGRSRPTGGALNGLVLHLPNCGRSPSPVLGVTELGMVR